jgi:hypothetical protein
MSQWISELGIYDYRHRMYHPGLGRFLQTDPIGLQTEGAKLSAGQKALFSPGGSAPDAFANSEMKMRQPSHGSCLRIEESLVAVRLLELCRS